MASIRLMDLEDALYVYGHPGDYPAETVQDAESMIEAEPARRVKMLEANVVGRNGTTDLLKREFMRMVHEREQLGRDADKLPPCFVARFSALTNAAETVRALIPSPVAA